MEPLRTDERFDSTRGMDASEREEKRRKMVEDRSDKEEERNVLVSESNEWEHGDWERDEVFPGNQEDPSCSFVEISECFARSSIWKKICETSKEVSECLGVTESEAILLLKEAGWEEEVLLERYLLDAEQICKRAGLTPPKVQARPCTKHLETYEFYCVICTNSGVMKVHALPCEHRYCDRCWKTYLGFKLGSGEVLASCPHFECNLRCTPEFIRSICPVELVKKFEQFLLNSYIDERKSLFWCPSPDCGLVVQASGQAQFIQCKHGHSFCTICKEEFHLPASCDLVKEWNQKCQDDTETANWLVANTKNCPRCSTTIEKDGGCNHMLCSKCKHEFCWVCMEEWILHTNNYTCNRYDPSQMKTDKFKAQNAKGVLNRYLFYYHRYMNHWNSLRLDKKTRAKAEHKMSQYVQLNEGALWSDFSFIGEAVNKLLQCRQTLKWTYVLAWKMEEDNPERALFCYLQENLELKTEKLSGLLESSISDLMRHEVRHEILNLAHVTYHARCKLLKGVSSL